MTVTTPLKGYPHLKVSDVVKGRLFDIKHKWVKFNGVSEHGGIGGFERRRSSLLIVLSRPSSKEVCFVKVTHCQNAAKMQAYYSCEIDAGIDSKVSVIYKALH